MKHQVHTSRFFLPSFHVHQNSRDHRSITKLSFSPEKIWNMHEPLLAYLSSYLLKPRTPHDPELTLLTTVKQLNTVAHCSTHFQALGYRPATTLGISWHLYLVMSSKLTFLSGLLSETFFPPHLPPSLPLSSQFPTRISKAFLFGQIRQR